jgi:XTP/dITP diphosphohydrolase
MRIHLATANAHKVREFSALAAAILPGIRFAAADPMPPVVEDTGSFVGNACKKAAALAAVCGPGEWVLADDSGICVDALGGAPGVESAYFAGPRAGAGENLAKLVRLMRDVPEGRRGAHFVCVRVLQRGPEGRPEVFEGRCEGTLRREPAGAAGFGYDPLFVPQGESRTYAELGDAEKNRISHRAKAVQALARGWNARER